MAERNRLEQPTDDVAFSRWAKGYGAIAHSRRTRAAVLALATRLREAGIRGDGVELFEVLSAADRAASAAMWLVVHETYAQSVYMDGRDLTAADFKSSPEGHTGGSLNMVPAYTGYMAANVLAGFTRAWLMGQGHCVAAVDSLNLLLGNMTPAHAARYDLSDGGLTRYVRDFYSHRLASDGRPDSPLGSHVNAHTAGGLIEGGYLGFAELQYVHMPLPGERLVAFLSDGAFEEQRGSDWAPRWWRLEDSGLVAPIMISNGRRIDQRTTMSQQGGVNWFARHLRLNGFDPIVFDGRDPAAFVCAIFEIERRLEAAGRAVAEGRARYPVRLPYGVAVAPKGAGFYGEGTNLAHNLPLGANPAIDATAAARFNQSARRLWVAPAELREALERFQHHAVAGRPRERDHALATRDVRATSIPVPAWRGVPDRHASDEATASSPMTAVDAGFLDAVRANPHLRPRVGNPDEMRSNRMVKTLEALRFRVTAPEAGIPEAVDGVVITALNEEAVVSAALANKGGINIVVTYEAFGAKMLGAVRQEVVFASHLADAGRPAGWLSVPLVLTSHTWENAKNEQSHQDPTLAEALLGEPAPFSRVLFPADSNTAAAVMENVYQTRGQIWCLVVPKADAIPDRFTADESRRLLAEGAIELPESGHRSEERQLVITAIGAYQLGQALRASARLRECSISHSVAYMLEPGRFRHPRSRAEAEHLAPEAVRRAIYPEDPAVRHLVLSHTRPEPVAGVLAPLHAGRRATVLGYISRGGTLDTAGLLFVNRSTWAHAVEAAAGLLDRPLEALLNDDERAALSGEKAPAGVVI